MVFALSAEQKERYLSFWHRGSVCGPCVGFEVADGGTSSMVNPLQLHAPWLIRPESLDDWYESKYLQAAALSQDSTWTAAPPSRAAWAEGMIVRPSASAEPVFARDSRWFAAYRELLEHLLDRSIGRYPVGNAAVSGITDLLANEFGVEHLRSLIEADPSMLSSMARTFGAGLDAMWRALEALLPDEGTGSFIAPLHLWAPGTSFRYHEGHAQLFRADAYARIVLPAVETLIARYEYTIFSVPGGARHILDMILRIPALTAVEVHIDPDVPGFTDLLPIVHAVQEHGKVLVVRGTVTEEDIERAAEELSWRGVYLLLEKRTLSEARFWASYLAEHNTFREAGL